MHLERGRTLWLICRMDTPTANATPTETRPKNALVSLAQQVPAPSGLDSLPLVLQNSPPSVSSFAEHSLKGPYRDGEYTAEIGPIQLRCDAEDCVGTRFFDPIENERITLRPKGWTYAFLRFRCRHCKKTEKLYAIAVQMVTSTCVEVFKFGERPLFGPYVPARLLKFVGEDQDMFNKGRRSESMGLGIAAFAYYRRVVENQKSRLIQHITKVARRLEADSASIDILDAAAKEIQFSRAVAMIKDAIPEVLRIKKQNPLTLLHDALSDGLHAKSDADCLEFATAIRLILTEFVQRVNAALEEHAEVEMAVSKLLNRHKEAAGKAAKETSADPALPSELPNDQEAEKGAETT